MTASGMYPVAWAQEEHCGNRGCDFALMLGDGLTFAAGRIACAQLSCRRRACIGASSRAAAIDMPCSAAAGRKILIEKRFSALLQAAGVSDSSDRPGAVAQILARVLALKRKNPGRSRSRLP